LIAEKDRIAVSPKSRSAIRSSPLGTQIRSADEAAATASSERLRRGLDRRARADLPLKPP
jgi:hypothetical protein